MMAFLDRDRFVAAQARSREVASTWRESDGHRRATAIFAGLENAPAEAVADAAEALIGNDGWPAAMLTPLIAALAADDWFDPPFRVSRDALRIGAVLFDSPIVSIAASVLSADILATLPAPATLVVPGRLSVVRYWRANGAMLRRWHVARADDGFVAATAPPCVEGDAVILRDGMTLRIDGRDTGQLIAAAPSDLVMLTATIRRDASPFMREYAIDGGALVRVAALDEAAARTQMLLALLRHMGRTDAADCFDAASRDPAFFVRWQAMREWIALDAAAALPRLRVMADDPHPEVRQAATQTATLVERRLTERLAERLAERVPCPA